MSNIGLIVTNNDFSDHAKEFKKAIEGSYKKVLFKIDSPGVSYDLADISMIFVVRSANAGCSYFDAEGGFSDTLLDYVNTSARSGVHVGFVLCYPSDGKKSPQRDFKRLITNQPELSALYNLWNVHFMDFVVPVPKNQIKISMPWSLGGSVKWERKHGLVRIWPHLTKPRTIIVRVECLPSYSGEIDWELVCDEHYEVSLGEIHYSHGQEISLRKNGFEFLPTFRKVSSSSLEMEVTVPLEHQSKRFRFSKGVWKAESEALNFPPEMLRAANKDLIVSSIKSFSSRSVADVAKQLQICFGSLEEFSESTNGIRNVASGILAIASIDGYREILQELSGSNDTSDMEIEKTH